MHGLSLNVEPCAEKFTLINPCGLGDVRCTALQEFASSVSWHDAKTSLVKNALSCLEIAYPSNLETRNI
jgi:lipoate-protein ligase B